MNPVQIRCHEDQAQQAVDALGDADIGVRDNIQARIKHFIQDRRRRRYSEQDHSAKGYGSGHESFKRMETHRRADIQVRV